MPSSAKPARVLSRTDAPEADTHAFAPPPEAQASPWMLNVGRWTLDAGRRSALAASIFLFASCNKKPAPSAPPTDAPAPALHQSFSGERAMQHVTALVNFGPRPSGSAALERARQYIVATLTEAGWEAERQEFEATPVPGKGALKFANIIARFGPQKNAPAPRDTQRFIIGSHYDTKRMLGVTFVGANDGGSSTGALLELARVAPQKPAFAQQLELVFFDGEEAVESFGDAVTGTDGLVGSRHYARELRQSGRAKQFHSAVVWDMIGDKKFQLTLPADSPRELASGILVAAEQLGVRKHVAFFGQPILDDHVPLALIARIPAIDLIDFEYPAWHTSGDTLDQLSPESLRITGQITLWYLEREFAR